MGWDSEPLSGKGCIVVIDGKSGLYDFMSVKAESGGQVVDAMRYYDSPVVAGGRPARPHERFLPGNPRSARRGR